MEQAEYRFNIKDLPGGVFTLIPLGDIQYDGSKESSSLKLLKETIDRGTKAGAYYIGMGDYTDFLSPSNRERLKTAGLYDTAHDVIERTGEKLVEEIAEILAPTKGRWLGLLEGHHFQEFAAGDTSDMRLARILGTKHLGTSAYIHLVFTQGSKAVETVIWCQHGIGNGQSPAAPISKLDNVMRAFEADIYLLGHMTKLAHTPTNRIYPSWRGADFKLHHRTQHLVGTGGFSRGIQVGRKSGQVPRGTYVEQGMMRPTALGAPTIRIEPVRVTERHGSGAPVSDTLTLKSTVEL